MTTANNNNAGSKDWLKERAAISAAHRRQKTDPAAARLIEKSEQIHKERIRKPREPVEEEEDEIDGEDIDAIVNVPPPEEIVVKVAPKPSKEETTDSIHGKESSEDVYKSFMESVLGKGLETESSLELSFDLKPEDIKKEEHEEEEEEEEEEEDIEEENEENKGEDEGKDESNNEKEEKEVTEEEEKEVTEEEEKEVTEEEEKEVTEEEEKEVTEEEEKEVTEEEEKEVTKEEEKEVTEEEEKEVTEEEEVKDLKVDEKKEGDDNKDAYVDTDINNEAKELSSSNNSSEIEPENKEINGVETIG